jgi:virulence-associated protein VagC
MAYEEADQELIIERSGDTITLRPAKRSVDALLAHLRQTHTTLGEPTDFARIDVPNPWDHDLP